MSNNIKVAIKVRPLIDREKKAGDNVSWKVTGNTITQIDPSTGKVVRDGYTFDHVFGMAVTNADIFDKIVKPFVHPTVDGFNTTIFAYGQTSSGKTYTMLGSKEEPGIITLTVSAMFDAMQHSNGREFLVRASYMEIYNEKINDLLDKKFNLKIREEDGKAVVPGLKEEVVTTTEKVLSLMRRGQKNRHIGETNMNERSSRSHTIFRLVVESREARGSRGDYSEDDDVIKVSHLNMVDLAGSERSDQTGNKFGSDRFREGCHINLSLFKLSQVISQLSEGKKHISFRDSKLTRILEPSLGGNSLTAIICNVTPASIDETNCTLSFASRAKKIKNEPHVNEVLSNGTLLKRYACQLAKLKEELEKAKSQEMVQEMESKLIEKDRLNKLLQERIDRLSKQLIGTRASQNIADGSGVGVTRGPPLRRKTWAGAALSIIPLRRMEPIPESPGPIISKQTNTSTEAVVPLEEFERDLLDADELTGTTADSDDFFPSSFVNFRRGSERNTSACEIFDANTSGADEEIDLPVFSDSLSQTSDPDSHSPSMTAGPIMQKLDVSCQTSPATKQNIDASSDSVAAETPPHIIRASLKELQKEYEELREFTKLERQIYEEKPEMASVHVQTTTPCCTRDTSTRFAAEKQRCVSYTDIDSQERAAVENTEQVDSSERAHTSQISPNFDHLEESSCLKTDTFTTKDEESSYSLMQLKSKLNELTAENTAQKSEILTLNSMNEELRNRMLSEIATLSQDCSGDEVKSVDNVAIFDRFVKSIIHKEEEVIKIILEDSNNKLSAKENWISQLEKQVVSLEQELEDSQKEKNDLCDKLLAQKETLTALEQDRLYVNKKLTTTESDMSFLQEENKDLTLRLRAAEDKITKLSENEKCLLLNIEKEKEQRTQLEDELWKIKQKFEELTNNVECSLRTDEKLLLSETHTLKEQMQKLELENACLVESMKKIQEECSEAKAVATQHSECLKSVKKQLISLVSVFPDHNRIMYHSFEQILAFVSEKLSLPCDKCSQLTSELQKMKLKSETLMEDTAVHLEKQKQLEYTNVSGSFNMEGKDVCKLSSSVAGDSEKVSFHSRIGTVNKSLPVKETEVFNQKAVVSIGVNTSDGCKCEEVNNENQKLIQEAVARRCKIAQLQEEVANQANIIAQSDSELKEAQHKIRVYKLELKQLQRAHRTSYQVNQSRTYCDAATQAVDVNMYINYGCGAVTDTLAESLRLSVFDLRKKNEKLTILYRTQKDEVNMLKNKITELKGEKKTYSNVRVQTDDKKEANLSNKIVQVDMFPQNASQHEIGQIIFWKSRAEQRLEEKKWLKALCATLEKQINEMKKKPEPLAIRNLAYTLHDDDILCIGRPKPLDKENKYPFIDKQ